jgi:hypothetical protein
MKLYCFSLFEKFAWDFLFIFLNQELDEINRTIKEIIPIKIIKKFLNIAPPIVKTKKEIISSHDLILSFIMVIHLVRIIYYHYKTK